MTRTSRALAADWTISASGRAVPPAVAAAGPVSAAVPGSVTTDLLAAGLIDDPYLDDNEAAQKWIGVTDWRYHGRFGWEDDGSERQELLFRGVDTVAAIALNDTALATTRNMHRSYRLDVTDLLRDRNDIDVAIAAPVPYADGMSLQLGYRPHTNHHPYNAIRKMACSFGWDWGIDTATSGLWRPVELHTWSTARFDDVRVTADVADGVPVAVAHLTVARTSDVDLTVTATVAGHTTTVRLPSGATSVSLDVAAPGAELWYPRGHGRPSLHDLRITLHAGEDLLDVHDARVGFRSVAVITAPDADGIGFELRVNDERILVKGANWIPDDAFPHRVDRARYADRLAQAEWAGINLIRVWGGGIYESDDFYAECDERGLLSWQDFLFACAAYAEEEPLRGEVVAEAREAITRISAHPSLIIWNGNNENIWGFQDWKWEPRLDGRTWGAGYYYDVLPSLVAELAPHTAYTPGSPFSPDPSAPQNDPNTGTAHIWDLWNEKDYPHYRDYRPRFVSEFGWQGPPTWSALRRAVSDEPLTPESPGMLVHQKANSGNHKLTDGLIRHFPLPDDMDDWHWAMSLNQAIAVRTAIEWFRSLTPHCTGSIMWQLNDCWPVTSWAAVDGDGRAKPLLHALRQANADRLITLQPDGDAGRVALVNDTAEPWRGVLRVLAYVDSESETVIEQAVDVPARDSLDIAVPRKVADQTCIVAELGDARAVWTDDDHRRIGLRRDSLATDVRRTETGWQVHVTARSLTKDLILLIDRLDPGATVDLALVTLLPGQEVTFTVTGATTADDDELVSPLVLRSANDLVPDSSRADRRDSTRADAAR